MNRALLAGLIFVSVAAFVALQAVLMKRWTSASLDAAAEEAAHHQGDAFGGPSGPKYTKQQVQVYVGLFFVQFGLLVAGGLLLSREGALANLGAFLVALSFGLMIVRFVLRYRLGRAASRKEGAPTKGQIAG